MPVSGDRPPTPRNSWQWQGCCCAIASWLGIDEMWVKMLLAGALIFWISQTWDKLLDEKIGLSKKDRQKLISRISRASGIAQYALEAKMTDDHVIEAASNLKVFALIKDANNYNRYCQSQKTAEANAKLKQFLDPKNSEIYKAGYWLINTLLKVGQDRKRSLLEKDLVHKNDYNDTINDLRDKIKM